MLLLKAGDNQKYLSTNNNNIIRSLTVLGIANAMMAPLEMFVGMAFLRYGVSYEQVYKYYDISSRYHENFDKCIA